MHHETANHSKKVNPQLLNMWSHTYKHHKTDALYTNMQKLWPRPAGVQAYIYQTCGHNLIR